MKPTIFFTGFPGFIGSRLVEALLREDPTCLLVGLVQPKFASLAGALLQSWPQEMRQRVRCVQGDLQQPGLGLGSPSWRTEITEVYHLAAVYDLSVRSNLADQINVEGTRRVVSFARTLPKLGLFHHVSTAYVSGDFRGTYTEEDFDCGQGFKNHYERTKFLAEKLVRESGLAPLRIYRPAIVVGDSTTGLTEKLDGPYFMIGALRRLPRWLPVPTIGSARVGVNLVPIDFVIGALVALRDVSEQVAFRVYHLVDGEPLSGKEIIQEFCNLLGRKRLPISVPPTLVKMFFRLTTWNPALRVPPQAVDYMHHPVKYTSQHMIEDLGTAAPVCPPARQYLPLMVDFAVAHPGLRRQALA